MLRPLSSPRGALICGYYGAGNWGDEAMLAGMIRLLHGRISNYPLTVISRDSADTVAKHKVWTFPACQPFYRSKKNLFNYWLRQSKFLTTLYHPTFILGGGDLLRDGTQYEVAGFWLSQMEQALKMRRKTILLGVSVGEIWKPSTIELIPKILNQVNLLTVRDESSKVALESLGVTREISVISDLALQGLKIHPRSVEAVSRHPKIGISIRSLSNRGRQLEGFQHEVFQREFAKLLDILKLQFNADIYFFPFQAYPYFYNPEDDDYIAAMQLLKFSQYSSDFHVPRYIPSLQELCEGLSEMDLVIGLRLHSVILASAQGVPTIAVEYDPKVRGFMEMSNQLERSVSLESFNRERVLPLVERMLQSSHTISQSVLNNIEVYKKRMESIIPALDNLL